jgi:outer membrane protein assembly factor BamD (BamD/ComL family)
MEQQKSARRYPGALKGLVVLFLSSLVLGCYTVPEEVPEDLSQMEIFQLAQEAAENDRWDVTRLYYETYLDRFPEDWPNRIAARYEIAFTYYKEGRLDTAEVLFQSVLATYAEPEERPLPAWPRVLSERVLEKIEEVRSLPPARMFGSTPRE